jgi:hypothetical protein
MHDMYTHLVHIKLAQHKESLPKTNENLCPDIGQTNTYGELNWIIRYMDIYLNNLLINPPNRSILCFTLPHGP